MPTTKKNSLIKMLEERKKEITGMVLDDGSMVLGQLVNVFENNGEIWVEFRGVSPIATKEGMSLSEFLVEGPKNPEAMVIYGLYPVSAIHHFIFAISTQRILQDTLSNSSNDDGKVLEMSVGTESKITQEKVN